MMLYLPLQIFQGAGIVFQAQRIFILFSPGITQSITLKPGSIHSLRFMH
ncbi:hypothetical protein J2Y45_005804 [Dyadobacter sp. BE34]|uniref:Uncharacterized protein n=1 Tax=Dyadobacter fermentans TaxID=94254 RepID=A0ABU1R5U7_9BACT|nr:hypothetical protein [Dyadobacter fermentans]MDR7046335.1 hypothetical protein [Dyadobacter sp. BE242]MDR7200648.1 hypothetical protein [Dyadobacter sp. BE34]MDR7218608.1 hypothetical protein [Dyadobacter sp. BE31]MDR7266538.1 hypothetical protein [Dyadobacter sp. BE32]